MNTGPIQGRSETAAHADRLAYAVETMRELSRQGDAERMVGVYRQRITKVVPTDQLVTISRRDMPAPWYRITRSSHWTTPIDPWKDFDRQPRFDRGLLGELIYGDQPVIIDDLCVAPDDPAAEYFEGQRSLMAVPLFDGGVGLNMVVAMRRERAGFNRERLPEQVWMSNLFGQLTQNLALSADLREAYDAVDRELRAVAQIQQSLLPTKLPHIPTLELAAHYQTSRRAGGDYYDFFELPDGEWGILIADVSGHGTPAAVLMAITHSIAHLVCEPPAPAARLMAAINERLCTLYTAEGGQFVTASYVVYQPATRRVSYATAGHPQPRIRRRDGSIESLEGARALPLGILRDERYCEAHATLNSGDALVLYTDGITEARSPTGELFDTCRLDHTLAQSRGSADGIVADVLTAVETFTASRPASDDRTLLVARVCP
ncbi:MAG TPA: SpoIIE family protein phosphatase [Tepidisphaeraceae bacterium]|jgi:sigma-B regulation protein RsbU (phosphoserine phosphatase)